MTFPPHALESLVQAQAPEPFHGIVWRTHWNNVDATDWSLSLRSSGRYHRGRDLESDTAAWAALYTSRAPEVAVWEMVRRSAVRDLRFLKNNVLSELDVDLSAVLDLTDPSRVELSQDDLTGSDATICQSIGRVAFQRGIQGLLVPSATQLGTNLVCFPQNFTASSIVRLVRSTELPLSEFRQHLVGPSE